MVHPRRNQVDPYLQPYEMRRLARMHGCVMAHRGMDVWVVLGRTRGWNIPVARWKVSEFLELLKALENGSGGWARERRHGWATWAPGTYPDWRIEFRWNGKKCRLLKYKPRRKLR